MKKFIQEKFGNASDSTRSSIAIIFTLEPVFATIFAGLIIGNEILSVQAWFGCGLIFLSNL